MKRIIILAIVALAIVSSVSYAIDLFKTAIGA